VMLSLLAGSAVAGFWGVLLGVPAVAVAKVTLGHLWATRVLGAQVSPRAVRQGGRDAPSVVPEPAAGADTEGGGDSLAHGEDAVEPSASPAGARPPGD
jgi:hypothetical protein